MRWNKKYNYPSSSRATEDGIRRYVLGEVKLPSVTSILDATKSEEDKAALANWRERTGYKEAEKIVERNKESRQEKMNEMFNGNNPLNNEKPEEKEEDSPEKEENL